jgi:hypothetical protein
MQNEDGDVKLFSCFYYLVVPSTESVLFSKIISKFLLHYQSLIDLRKENVQLQLALAFQVGEGKHPTPVPQTIHSTLPKRGKTDKYL